MVLSVTIISCKMLALMIPQCLGVNRSQTLKSRTKQLSHLSLEVKRHKGGASHFSCEGVDFLNALHKVNVLFWEKEKSHVTQLKIGSIQLLMEILTFLKDNMSC